MEEVVLLICSPQNSHLERMLQHDQTESKSVGLSEHFLRKCVISQVILICIEKKMLFLCPF